VACLFWAAAACARQGAAGVTIDWRLHSSAVAGTPMLAELTLRDAASRPISGARLEITAHMSHPGMAPVMGAAEERRDGVYDVRLQLPMAGDWTILVTGSLPDGHAINQRIDIAGVRPAG